VLGAKARAALDGRAIPDLDDVRSVARGVLRHRLVLNFQAEADGVSADSLLEFPA
jgi:MoxR-like ATPase